MTCPICLEELKDLVKTKCGHAFCKNCLKESKKHKQECPVCRCYFDTGRVVFAPDTDFIYSNISDKLTKDINIESLKDADLVCWVDKPRYFSPVYRIKEKNILISSYLRYVLLSGNMDWYKLKTHITEDYIKFYCTDQHIKTVFFDKRCHDISEAWIYDVTIHLSKKFCFYNYKYLLVIVNDLAMKYIITNNVSNEKLYQAIICGAIFIAMEVYNNIVFKPHRGKDFFLKLKKEILFLTDGEKNSYKYFNQFVRKIKKDRYKFDSFLSRKLNE